MYKKLLPAIGMLLLACKISVAQYTIHLTIADTTIISYVTQQGKPVFTLAGINGVINQYTVTGFEKAFPSSRFAYKRKVYKMTVSSMNLPVALTTSYPTYFLHYETASQGEVLSYTPNDFASVWPYKSRNT